VDKIQIMRKKIISNIPLFLLAMIFIGCKGFHYDEKKKIADSEWAYQDLMEFNFEISDTNSLYNIYLEVSHAADYSAQNLYSKVHVTFPDATERKQQVSIELADSRGEWLGNCGSKKCTRRISFMPNAAFEQVGKYKLKFEQYSRLEKIKGIESLRLIVEKLKNKKEASENIKNKVS
jgi:gliding motility-associated lipoprotein GldH